MAFSKLKQLSDLRLSPLELAALLEEHIGDGSNEFHCELACKAFNRIRNPRVRDPILIMKRLLQNEKYSEIVKAVIMALRSEGWGSTC